jgi:hypothetical protein
VALVVALVNVDPMDIFGITLAAVAGVVLVLVLWRWWPR